MILAAVLGGAYSSTVTTVVLAKRAAREEHPHLLRVILVTSGVMYLRLAVLVGLFDRALLARLAPAFLALAAAGMPAGWLWSRRPDPSSEAIHKEFTPRNPLELHAAFLFALLFLALLVVTQLGAPPFWPWWLVPGRHHGSYRRGSLLHSGLDPIAQHGYAGTVGGYSHPDRGRQQQCGQGHLCLRIRRSRDRAAERRSFMGTGCLRPLPAPVVVGFLGKSVVENDV